MTVALALASAAALGLDRLDAQLLLLHALGRPQHDRAWLLAHDGDALGGGEQARFEMFCARRRAAEPLAYIVGHKEFFGLELQVDARVLVPRPATETLVEWALELIPVDCGAGMPHGAGAGAARVIDLGTGSGAIALAVKKQRPLAAVDAVDVSTDALEVARANARALGLEIRFHHASWLGGLDGCYHFILGNPPYVAQADPHLAALRHEPLAALAAGADGLDAIRAIVGQAPPHLHPGGWLLLEHGWDQAEAVRDLLRAAGLTRVESRRDLAGIDRCSGGQRLELG